jgi:prepilin-type N-terminal cleavage/methylation domain-containing protein
MTNSFMRNIRSQISNIKNRIRGFTLIETLVAVLLLTTAVAGPLTIASKGLSAALIARDQMIAFYLAQDGIEYIRFVRDSNKLGGAAWLNGLDACQGASGCTIDPSTATITACPSSGGCPAIRKHVAAGNTFFSYDSGDSVTPQNFVRTITLATPTTGETTEAILTVAVSWRAQSGVTRTVTVRENLLDWQ